MCLSCSARPLGPLGCVRLSRIDPGQAFTRQNRILSRPQLTRLSSSKGENLLQTALIYISRA